MSKIASAALLKSMEDAKREPAKATGHMRERLAVAIYGSSPSFYNRPVDGVYRMWLYKREGPRRMYEQWADEFLLCCDELGLGVIDLKKDD